MRIRSFIRQIVISTRQGGVRQAGLQLLCYVAPPGTTQVLCVERILSRILKLESFLEIKRNHETISLSALLMAFV